MKDPYEKEMMSLKTTRTDRMQHGASVKECGGVVPGHPDEAHGSRVVAAGGRPAAQRLVPRVGTARAAEVGSAQGHRGRLGGQLVRGQGNRLT